MKEYNEVMRVSWENGEEKWGFTPRQDEEEIEKLRQQNAELVDALKFYACDCQYLDGCSIADCGAVARKAITKATEGEK